MKAPASIAGVVLCISVYAIQLTNSERVRQESGSRTVQSTRRSLPFEENRGQSDPRAKYLARAGELNLFMTDDHVIIVFADGSSHPPVITLELNGANRTSPVGARALDGTTSYFMGTDPSRWLTNVATYSEVTYFNVYDGIDWVFHGDVSQSRLEYDFVVAPGADPHDISIRISGADSIDLASDRRLAIDVSGRRFYMNNLYVFQSVDGERIEVAAHFVKKATDVIAFEIDEPYDPTRPLVLDPVLTYATYLGGGNTDRAFAPAVDRYGRAYLTGTTASLNFPTDNPAQVFSGGNFDAYIARFSADGSALEYSTYFGGSEVENGLGIAVDEDGNAYVCGRTGSANMPVAAAFQPGYGGGPSDVFILKLDPTGSRLLFSTFLGGTGDDRAFDCRLDASGAIYVSGTTASPDFPIVHALQSTYGGNQDAFLAKMDSGGSTLVYARYLGGSALEQFGALAVDGAGRAAVIGKTASVDFPVANAAQPIYGGGTGDAFVSRYHPTGSSFIYSTYIGGSGDDAGLAPAITRRGEVILGGNTASTDYPLVNALQSTMAGVRDLIITKLDRRGQIVFSTYLGGSANENAFGLAADPHGNVYFSGFTASPNFPLSNALQSDINGPIDAIFGKISATGDALIFSTYFGGSGEDRGDYVVIDSVGGVYFSGWTSSADFPATPGAFQTSFGGPQFDAFLVKLADDQPDPVTRGPFRSSLRVR